MRILHVTPYYEDTWAYGGIPRAVAATARALARRGHDVTVCTTDVYLPDARLATPGKGAARTGGVEVRVFPNLSNKAAYHLQLFAPLGLNGYLRSHAGDFDVAHLHGCRHLPGVLAARHLRRARVPYVLTPHGTAPHIERRRVAKWLFDAIIGNGVVAGAARVIAVSTGERNQLVEMGISPHNTYVIPNPVDLAEFGETERGAFRRRLGLGPDVPIILFLGKLTPRKRLDVLVQAFAALAWPDARLVIAGNDMGYGRTLRADLQHFGVADRTIVTGLLCGADRLAALRDADVVAYPSEHEVFGLVAVESLLCGTPVVVADDSGCGEVVGGIGGGLLVEPGNADELRDALGRMLADRATWRERAAAARLKARQYGSDQVCLAIEAIYHSLAAGRVDDWDRAVV